MLQMWRYNHERPNMALGGIPLNSGWPWPHSFTSQCGVYGGLTFLHGTDSPVRVSTSQRAGIAERLPDE